MGITYHYEDRPDEIVMERFAMRGWEPIFYRHQLRHPQDRDMVRNLRNAVDAGFIYIHDPYTMSMQPTITSEGHLWLNNQNIQFIERLGFHKFQLEFATKEEAFLVKLAWC